MRDYLLSVIGCLCLLLPPGLHAEECSQAVLARRETFYVPEGGSLSLSCVVQHCGDTWTGNWTWNNETCESTVGNSERYSLTDVAVSAKETRLVLTLQQVNQSDQGHYSCKVSWGQGYIDVGHLMYVNVTAAVPSQRTLLHRLLVCVCAFLCLPVILGLARCVRSEVKPHPHPRTRSTHVAVHRVDEPGVAPLPPPRCPVQQKHRASSHKASPKSQQKTEVLYADVSMEALRPTRVVREPPPSTVYSSLTFS